MVTLISRFSVEWSKLERMMIVMRRLLEVIEDLELRDLSLWRGKVCAHLEVWLESSSSCNVRQVLNFRGLGKQVQWGVAMSSPLAHIQPSSNFS